MTAIFCDTSTDLGPDDAFGAVNYNIEECKKSVSTLCDRRTLGTPGPSILTCTYFTINRDTIWKNSFPETPTPTQYARRALLIATAVVANAGFRGGLGWRHATTLEGRLR